MASEDYNVSMYLIKLNKKYENSKKELFAILSKNVQTNLFWLEFQRFVVEEKRKKMLQIGFVL